MLTNAVAKADNSELVFGTVLNPDASQISTRLQQVVKVSAVHIDCTRRLADFINAMMGVLFEPVTAQMSLAVATQLGLRGVRLFQVYLRDLV